MAYQTIRKEARCGAPAPNLHDYDRQSASFTWSAARRELDGLPAGGLNIAHEALDRFVGAGRGGQVAMRFIARDRTHTELTYADLSGLASRFANVLAGLGIVPGERVFSLAGRIPELYAALFGALKARAVFCPLFSAFGPGKVGMEVVVTEGQLLEPDDQFVNVMYSGLSEDDLAFNFLMTYDEG